jgi:Zn-dependent protease with chaperone function
MNFFEHQDRAKARSRKFVLLYATSVALICIVLATIAGVVVYFLNNDPNANPAPAAALAALATATLTALLIGSGSAYRIAQLKGGGSAVARSLGGILIDPSTRDPHQKQLLNIVEEMSIASGVPVPPVYFMPNEKGINAFAAGYTPGDAVIGVTYGCLHGLKREELQGVIAHEFSHILNGDMKLNIRMIGFLNGILLLTIIGHILLRYAPHTARDKNGVPVLVVMLVVAISMLIIGSIGALAAKIIQASVSRQREFLADASAVQFTRNPDGIANALRRLASKPRSTKIRHPRAEESAHMFFGEALKLGASLATHPPLKERIKRINPQWDGTFLPPLPPKESNEEAEQPQAKQSAQDRLRDNLNKRMGSVLPDAVTGAIPDPLQHAALLTPLLALSGTMSPAHIDHARTIIQSIPEPLKEAAHDISSSRAVVYALLLDRSDARVHTKQIHHLLNHADPAIAKLTDKLSSHATKLEPHLRLPLLDMTLASLAHLSDPQHQTFRDNVTALINMDKTIDLFEWVTIKVLTRHLDQRFGITTKVPVQYYTLKSVMTEVSTLLSVIAYTDTDSQSQAADSITLANTAFAQSNNTSDATLLPKDRCTLDTLSAALETLNTVTPRLKQTVLQACALTAAHDHNITTTEAELIRAIADTLSIPVPPLLPNQQLAKE